MREILMQACDMMNDVGLREEIEKRAQNAFSDDANLLVRCMNVCYREIASDYIKLYKEETLTTGAGGLIPYTQFSQKVNRIRSVKTSGGIGVRFKTYPSGIKLPEGAYTIEYSFMPDNLTADGLWQYGSTLNPDIMAAGTAAEFCLSKGLYDDSAMFYKKYYGMLKEFSGNGKSLFTREWF